MEFKRLPNGFGSVSKLSGNRRKPFMARKRDERGKYHIIGYFETENDAFLALKDAEAIFVSKQNKILFSGCFDGYMAEYYPNGGEATKKLKQAYKISAPLYKKRMDAIEVWDLEEVLKNPDIPRTLVKRIKQLWKGMWSYAIRHDICKEDPSSKVHWKIDNHTEKERKMLSPLELSMLVRKAPNSPIKDAVYILIYTGMRPSELIDLKVKDIDLKARKMIGGSKTDAGKNRAIPIHRFIKPIIEKWVNDAKENNRETLMDWGTYKTMRTYYLQDLPQLAERAEMYDFRHLMQTQCRECGVDSHVVNKIVGHRDNDITLDVYTHIGWNYLLKEYDKLTYLTLQSQI